MLIYDYMYLFFLIIGCTDSGQSFTINYVPSSCEDLIAHYPQLCFTWAAARDRLCCESCHRAGLQKQIPKGEYLPFYFRFCINQQLIYL